LGDSTIEADETHKELAAHFEIGKVDINEEVDPHLFDNIYETLLNHHRFVSQQFDKQNDDVTDHSDKIIRETQKVKLALAKNLAAAKGVSLEEFIKKNPQFGLTLDDIEDLSDVDDNELKVDEEGNVLPDARNQETLDRLAKIEEQNVEKLKEKYKEERAKLLNKVDFDDNDSEMRRRYRDAVSDNSKLNEEERAELLDNYDDYMKMLGETLAQEEGKQEDALRDRIRKRQERKRAALGKQAENKQRRHEVEEALKKGGEDIKDEQDQELRQINEEFLEEVADNRQGRGADKERRLKELQEKMQEQFETSHPLERQALLERFENEMKEWESQVAGGIDKRQAEVMADLNRRRKERMKKLKEKKAREAQELESRHEKEIEKLNVEKEMISSELGGDLLLEGNTLTRDPTLIENDGDNEEIQDLAENHLNQQKELELRHKHEVEIVSEEIQNEAATDDNQYTLEKMKMEEKLREERQRYEEEKRRLQDAVDSAGSEKEKKRHLLAMEEHEIRANLVMKISEEEQNNKLKNRLRERRQARENKKFELLQRQDKEKEAELLRQAKEKEELTSMVVEGNIEAQIQKIIETLAPEKVLPAVQKLFNMKHEDEIAKLLASQFTEKSLQLRNGLQEILERKALARKALKQEIEDAYQSLNNRRETMTPSKFEDELRKLKMNEHKGSREIDLKFQHEIEGLNDKIRGNIELKHTDEMLDLKEKQLREKIDLLRRFLGDQAADWLKELEEEEKNIQGQRGDAEAEKEARLREIHSKREDLIKQSEDVIKEEMEEFDRHLKEELDREKESAEKRFNEQKQNLVDQRKKMLADELERRKNITPEQRELLIKTHRQELANLQKALEAERNRQFLQMQEKLMNKMKKREEMRLAKEAELNRVKDEARKVEDEKTDEVIKEISAEEETKKTLQKWREVGGQRKAFDKHKWIDNTEVIIDVFTKHKEDADAISRAATLHKANNTKEKEVWDLNYLLKKVTHVERILENVDNVQYKKMIKSFEQLASMLERVREEVKR